MRGERYIGLDAHASSCTLGVMMPSGTLSEWLYEVLSPHAEKVVVAAVSESRGPKDDRRDAFGLAEGLRLGAIKRTVYKERGGFGALGYHAKGYRWIRNLSTTLRHGG